MILTSFAVLQGVAAGLRAAGDGGAGGEARQLSVALRRAAACLDGCVTSSFQTAFCVQGSFKPCVNSLWPYDLEGCAAAASVCQPVRSISSAPATAAVGTTLAVMSMWGLVGHHVVAQACIPLEALTSEPGNLDTDA